MGGVDPLELGFEFNKLSRFDDELVLLKNGIINIIALLCPAGRDIVSIYKTSRLGCRKIVFMTNNGREETILEM